MAHLPRQRSATAVQARTQQLLERDPEYAALKRLPELFDRSEQQWRLARDLETLLSLKYGTDVVPWPSQAGRVDYRASGAEFSATYVPAQDLNEYLSELPSRGGMTLLGGGWTPKGPIDPLQAKDPARLRVLVRLDLVTEHDIERLARQFRGALKACLRQAGRERHAMRWLRTVKPVVFNRDLRRYDLHREQGLTFRQIAYLEQEERRGRSLKPGELRGMPVRIAPDAESSIRTAVQRIYRSIYRVPYRARRQAPDLSNVAPYNCATHPRGDCPLDCPVLREWCARLWPSLPKPNSGA